MVQPPQPGRAPEARVLKALAHPLRKRILRHLGRNGPGTSTTLAHDLGENSGITSYHLRLLASNGLVEEIPERRRGKERWWRMTPEGRWIPPGGQVDAATRAALAEVLRLNWAEDLEQFERFRAQREAMGKWGHGTWASMGTRLRLTREEAGAFLHDWQELTGRYQREPADTPPDARTIVVRFLAYPEPLSPHERE
jgi:DNA-binding transcriptional ArsR family regulator